MKENVNLQGMYKIIIWDIKTGKEQIIDITNQLTKAYRQAIVSALAGTATNLQIKFIGFGTGSTPASEDDTRLEAEISGARKAPTIGGSAGINQGFYESTFVLLPNELAGQTIREIGIFAGSSATSSINTGTMISRINVNIEKTASQQIIFVRKDFVNI